MTARTIGNLAVNQVHLGDCRDLLRRLPDECINTVCTSPPYLGLRNYDLPASVWGGDPACAHDWQERQHRVETHSDDGSSGNLEGSRATQAETRIGVVRSSSCSRCGAWQGQLGLEPTPTLYVEHMVEVFREIRRVLRNDGTAWLVIGDSYAATSTYRAPRSMHTDKGWKQEGEIRGDIPNRSREQLRGGVIKPKDLMLIPWRVGIALQEDGWWVRSDIIWEKGSCLPESVQDRPTKSHEYVLLLAKDPRYFYDAAAIAEPLATEPSRWRRKSAKDPGREAVRPRPMLGEDREGRDGSEWGNGATRNRRSVWRINPEPFPEAHFAVMPTELVKVCVMAGTSERGACAACGTPWCRVVERPEMPRDGSEVRPNPRDGGLTAENGWERSGMSHFKAAEWMRENPPRTVGWKPSCTCDSAETVPCVVLDPFLGSGTVGLVAQDLGRDWIGFELNKGYSEIAAKRTAQAGLLGWRGDSGKAADGS